MAAPDPQRLGKTLSLLLKHRPELGQLELDADSWASVEAASVAAAQLMHQVVEVGDVLSLVEDQGGRFLELDSSGQRIRARQQTSRGRRKGRPPELLYHGTTVKRMCLAKERDVLDRGRGQDVYLSSSESQAWKVAHRLEKEPVVLVVEARRAARDGVIFRQGRGGLFLAESLPVKHILNLQDGFGEQNSAGGFLVREKEGQFQVALVRCRRGSRRSWEIAKGKLEPGETPQQAAKREMQEEMGFNAQLEVVHDLGVVRYAFAVPSVGPRLKNLHVYVMRSNPTPEEFAPRLEEGIQEVKWFSVEEAQRRVPHPSLRSVLSELVRLYGKGARNVR